MSIEYLNATKILDASRRHVTLIGKFSLMKQPPASWVSNELKEVPIDFELGYRNVVKTIGSREFDTFEVVCPKDADDATKSLPLKNSPLAEALASGGSARDAGGRIFINLLNALDTLAPFWHPEFDRLLSWGFFYYCRAKEFIPTGEKAKRVIEDSELMDVIFNAPINQGLLAYLRSSPEEGDANAPTSHLENTLRNHPLDKFIGGEAKKYRVSLANEQPGKMGDIQASLYSGEPDQARFLQTIKSPKFAGGNLLTLYREFRVAASAVERIARCEPLTALIIWWSFGKLTDSNDTKKIGEVIVETLYKTRPDWMPRLGAEELKADQSVYQNGWQKSYRTYLESLPTEKGEKKEDSAQAILYHLVMTELTAHRKDSWQPSQSFGRLDLIRRQVRTFMSLAAESIGGVNDILNEGREFLDNLQPVYREFEAAYGDSLTIEDLQKRVLNRLPKEMEAWSSQFIESHKNEKGTVLAHAFRGEFHGEIQRVQAIKLEAVLRGKGSELAKQLRKIGEVYRRQLYAQEGTQITASVPGGSLTGSAPVSSSQAKEEGSGSVRIRAGAQRMMRSAIVKPGGELPLTRDQAEKLQKAPIPNTKLKSEEQPDGSVSRSLEFDKAFDAQTLPETPDMSQTGDPIVDLAVMVEEYAKEMATFEQDLERVRTDILDAVWGNPEMAAKAPARGKIRANILGEYLLADKGELSPLGRKDSSLGIHALLELVEKVGAAKPYEGATKKIPGFDLPTPQNRPGLLLKGVDQECGIKNVDFHRIWEASTSSAATLLANITAYWRNIAFNVFKVKEYVADKRAVEELVFMLNKSGNARLTYFNETLLEHTSLGRDKLLVWSRSSTAPPPTEVLSAREEVVASAGRHDIPPPSVVVVSGQAKSASNPQVSDRVWTLDDDIGALESLLTEGERSIFQHVARLGRKTGAAASLPIFVLPSPLANDNKNVPCVYEKEIPSNWFVSALCGLRFFQEKLGDQYTIYEGIARNNVGRDSTREELMVQVVSGSFLEPEICAKLVSHLLAQYYERGLASFGAALWAAWQSIGPLLARNPVNPIRYFKDAGWHSFQSEAELPSGNLKIGIATTSGSTQREELVEPLQTVGALSNLLKPQ